MNKITSTENVRLDFVYNTSTSLIGVNTTEGHYFYIRDIIGNILGLIDNEGNYIVKYKYDVLEKVFENKIYESCIASRYNPFVYKGYFLDEETGLYLVSTRYYNPEWRVLSRVPILKPMTLDKLINN